jgi:hypothetical protein
VPSSEEVTSYLAAHSLEAVIEEAVNDAVLKQVRNPFEHIGELLLKHHAKVTGGESKRRVSIDKVDAQPKGDRKANFAAADEPHPTKAKGAGRESQGAKSEEEGLAHAYVKKDDVSLSAELLAKLKQFFDAMDADGDGSVTKEEAIKFWGKNFAKVNATST